MINSVVLLNWKPKVAESDIVKVTEGFRFLSEQIKEIYSYSYGKNLGLKGSNFQYALVARFETMEDFNAYNIHPEHLKFMAILTDPIIESYGAVQYLT